MALVVRELWSVIARRSTACTANFSPTNGSPWSGLTVLQTQNGSKPTRNQQKSKLSSHIFGHGPSFHHACGTATVKKCAWCRKRTSNARALNFEISQREAVLRPRTGGARDRGVWTFPRRPGDFPRKTFPRFQFHSPKKARSSPPNRLKRSKKAQCRKIGKWSEISKREQTGTLENKYCRKKW